MKGNYSTDADLHPNYRFNFDGHGTIYSVVVNADDGPGSLRRGLLDASEFLIE